MSAWLQMLQWGFPWLAFIHSYIHTHTIVFLYRYIHIALTKWFIYVHTYTRECRWWLPPQTPADWRLTVGQQTSTYLAAIITTTTRQITRNRRMSQKSNHDRQTTDKTTCWVVDLLRSTHCDRSSPRIEWEKRTRVWEYIVSLTTVQTTCLSLLDNEWNASNISKWGHCLLCLSMRVCAANTPTCCQRHLPKCIHFNFNLNCYALPLRRLYIIIVIIVPSVSNEWMRKCVNSQTYSHTYWYIREKRIMNFRFITYTPLDNLLWNQVNYFSSLC